MWLHCRAKGKPSAKSHTIHKWNKWLTVLDPASKLVGRNSSCWTEVTLCGSSMSCSSDCDSSDQTYSSPDRPPPTISLPSLQHTTWFITSSYQCLCTVINPYIQEAQMSPDYVRLYPKASYVRLLVMERKWFSSVTALSYTLWWCCYIKRYNQWQDMIW